MARYSVAIMFLASVTVSGQAQSPNDVLTFLLTTQSVPTGDFVKDREAAEATRATLARAFLVELTSVPLTTSSGGFNYRFNTSLGTLERVTHGFGPFFVDRASTLGRGHASVSGTFRYMQFESLDGRNLQDGSLVTTSNKFRDESAPFDVEALTLDIKTSTMTFFANYGVTDQIDVGVAVPIVELRLSGERVNTYRGTQLLQARGRANAFDLGDIPIRSKIQLGQVSAWHLATNLEVRLPTGDPEALTGSGRYTFGGTIIASAVSGPFESNINAGFSTGGVSDQAAVSGAVAATIAQRLTLSAEALARRIEGLKGIKEVAERNPFSAGVDTIRLLPNGSPTTTLAAVAGLHWNITGAWLLNSYVFVPVSDRGLVPRIVPAFSIDYSFEP